MIHRRCVLVVAPFIGVALSVVPFSSSFSVGTGANIIQRSRTLRGSANNNDPIGSYLHNLNDPQQSPNDNADTPSNHAEAEGNDDDTTLKAARFSIYAPDANALDADDFRSQLKDNMKAALEKRRAEDPNRGNQPTRNYLENL